MSTHPDDQLILNHLKNPDGCIRSVMLFNGWKWPKVRDVIIRYNLSVNSYLLDALSNEFRDPLDPLQFRPFGGVDTMGGTAIIHV